MRPTGRYARRSVAEAAGLDPPRRTDEVRRRFSTWWWPAIQMAVAAALAWALAQLLLDAPGGYGPITAIVAMGLGRERRIARSMVLLGGLLLGTAVAEVAGSVFGLGWWQVGVVLGATAILAGLLFDRDLAVTYATINAVVLNGIPASDGWMPTRLIDGALGVAAALVVTYGIVPSRPHRQLADRLRTVAARAADGLELSADELRSDVDDRRPDSARDAATRIDGELQRVPGTVDYALDLVRWAPLRRRDADRVEALVDASTRLVDALATASTVTRLVDRALVNDVEVGGELIDGLDRAAAALRMLVDDIIDEHPPDDSVAAECRESLEAVLGSGADQAVVIAIQEEVRGLLSDLIAIAEELTPGDSARRARSASTDGTTIGATRFGRSARR
jgi:uncharacterized membrane protein YgaE (UPF0421/DUF939 family)